MSENKNSSGSDASKNMRDPSNPNPYQQNYEFGIRGDASATVRGSLVALNTFSRYLQLKDLTFQNMKQKDLCNKSFIGKYAEWLSSESKSLTSGNLLKMGTATQYLSGLVTELRIKYPDDPIWEGIINLKDTPIWYHNIITSVEKNIKKRCADYGVPISKKVIGVGRELLKRMGNYIYVNVYVRMIYIYTYIYIYIYINIYFYS
jgi:hypothetical protein